MSAPQRPDVAGGVAPATGVTIVAMRPRDVRAVARLAAHDLHPAWGANAFRQELAQGDRRVYVIARCARRLVGWSGLLLTGAGGEAHITTIGVVPDERGRAIGTRLLAHQARTAIARGASDLTLEVRSTNEPALALYRRFGFAPAGVRAGYYGDGEDALVLWAHGIASAAYAERLAAIEAALPDETLHDGGPHP